MSEIEKVYCTSDNSAINPMLSALLSNQNGGNGMWNNPFVYLVWMMFAGRMWGNEGFGGAAGGENYNSRQIAALQDVVNTNHNNDLALQAINGNRDALGQLAQTFNCDLGQMQTAICGVKSAIEQVGGQVGYSAESVKNAIAMGDSNIVSKMQECCCQNNMLVQQMGYEGQLRDQANTASIMSRIDQLANGVQQGFSAVGYAAQQNTQAIIANATANTQRILDQMCADKTQDLRDIIAAKDRELLVAQIKGGCGCGCN